MSSSKKVPDWKIRPPVKYCEEAVPMKTITLERDYSQLTDDEKLEIVDACGDVRDNIRKLHNEAIGLARAVERDNYKLDRAKMERYVCVGKSALKELENALQRLPYAASALLLMAALTLSGCGSSGEHWQQTDAASGTQSARESQGVGGCSTGMCPRK